MHISVPSLFLKPNWLHVVSKNSDVRFSIICSDLSDDTDILRQRRCLTIQGNILLRKFHIVLYWCETCTFQELLFSYVYFTTMVEL